MSASDSSTEQPLRLISPEVIGMRPAMSRMRVLFPQPLGPTMVRSSPSPISKSMPSNAVTEPVRPSKTLRSRRHSIRDVALAVTMNTPFFFSRDLFVDASRDYTRISEDRPLLHVYPASTSTPSSRMSRR